MSADPIRTVEHPQGTVVEANPDGTVNIRDNPETNVGYAHLTRSEWEWITSLSPSFGLEGQR